MKKEYNIMSQENSPLKLRNELKISNFKEQLYSYNRENEKFT